MLITRDDVRPLSSWEPGLFASWLCAVFSGDYFSALNKRILPFIPTVPLIEQIATVFEYLSAEGKINFQNGLSSAIRESALSSEGVKVFEQLVDLAGLTQSRGAMKALVDKVLESNFLPVGERSDELFALVFNVVAGMVETQNEKKLLQKLTKSRHYKKKYAPMLQDALARTHS